MNRDKNQSLMYHLAKAYSAHMQSAATNVASPDYDTLINTQVSALMEARKLLDAEIDRIQASEGYKG